MTIIVQTTDTTNSSTLTPVQFLVARALASEYSHHWCGVPDGTYDLQAIFAWSDKNANSYPGINGPSLDDNGNVVHTTGSGRLEWLVSQVGDVILKMYRPLQANPAYDWRNPGEAAAMLIAHVTILNKSESSAYEFGEVLIGTSDYSVMYDRGEQLPGWNYVERGYFGDEGVYDDCVFFRHVRALMKPIVALLTMNAPAYEEESGLPYEEGIKAYQAWRRRIIEPAKDQARDVLGPISRKAWPDPWEAGRIVDGEPEERPDVCYIVHPDSQQARRGLYLVCKDEESFPVASEQIAVNATWRLWESDTISLADAVRLATLDQGYRPVATEEELDPFGDSNDDDDNE